MEEKEYEQEENNGVDNGLLTLNDNDDDIDEDLCLDFTPLSGSTQPEVRKPVQANRY